jgi:putative inorganic carbon (hco3(-)) transporter
MPTRAVWRPRWYAWTLLGVAALALTYKLFPARLEGHWLILTPVLVLVAVLALRRLWEVPPAPILCGTIALTIFSGNWRLIGLGGLPLDRLLAVIVLLQFLLRAPGVAHAPRLQIRNVHLLLCLTVMYVLASAVAAGTLTKESGFLSLFDELGVMPYVMFLVAPAAFSGQRERDLLLATLVGLGLYLGLTAIFESLGPQILVFPRYILHVDTELPGERAGGPFASSVAEGFATFACAVAAVIAFTRWHSRRGRYLAGTAAVVCLAGCFVTLERGVWIAAVVAAVVTALLTSTGRRWLVPVALAGATAIGAALAISPALSHKTSARVSTQISVWDRENQTSAGLRMVDAKPLFGFGWDRYRSDSREYFRQAAGFPLVGYVVGETIGQPEVLLPLHDTYLSYAVELGLVGTLLWLASLFWGVGGTIFSRGPAALRPWKLGLLAVVLFFVVVSIFNPYQPAFSNLLLWVWAGVALGCAPLPVRGRQPATPPRAPGEVAWTAA